MLPNPPWFVYASYAKKAECTLGILSGIPTILPDGASDRSINFLPPPLPLSIRVFDMKASAASAVLSSPVFTSADQRNTGNHGWQFGASTNSDTV